MIFICILIIRAFDFRLKFQKGDNAFIVELAAIVFLLITIPFWLPIVIGLLSIAIPVIIFLIVLFIIIAVFA